MPHAATIDVDLGQRPVRLAERDGLHRGFWQTSYEAALAWGNGTGAGTIPGCSEHHVPGWNDGIPWKIRMESNSTRTR